MKLPLARLSALGLLGLGLGIILPAVPSARARLTTACPDPTPKTCLTPGYLDSSCGGQKAAMCKDVVVDALEKQHAASRAPSRKMLRPQGSEMPRDVRVGKYRRYTGPKGKQRLAKQGKNPFADQRYSFVPNDEPSKLPTNAHRQPAWEANGDKVTSCQEYAYEKQYDWSRFMDSAAACRGSQSCLVEIGLMTTTPGLRHIMLSRDNQDLLHNPTLEKAVLPKNVFFSNGAFLAYAGGPKPLPQDPELDALVVTLQRGYEHHYIGTKPPSPRGSKASGTGVAKSSSPGTVKPAGPTVTTQTDLNPYYADEWAFHQTLRTQTKGMSIEEFEELGRRRALMRELLEMWYVAVEAERKALEDLVAAPDLVKKFELPIETVVQDPLDFLGMAGKRVDRAKSTFQLMHKQLGTKASGWVLQPGKPASKGVGGAHGQLRPLPEIDADLAAVGVFAAPRPRVRTSTSTSTSTGAARPSTSPRTSSPRVRVRPGSPARPGGPEATSAPSPAAKGKPTPIGAGPVDHVFNGGVILDAYDAVPCTDSETDPFSSSNPGHAKFAETNGVGPISCRIGTLLRHEWKRHRAGYVSCLDLHDPSCDWDPEMFAARFVEGVPYLQDYADAEKECEDWVVGELPMPNLKAVDDKIAEIKKAVKAAKKALSPYTEGKNGLGFNQYAYPFVDEESWGDTSTFGARYRADIGWSVSAQNKIDGKACAFNGEAHASLGVYGYLLGSQHTIVDVASRVDADASGAKLDAKLVLFGDHLFGDKNDMVLTKAFAPKPAGKHITLPKPKPTIYVQAGPVPVSGSAWAELFFGAELRADGKRGVCNDNDAFHVGGSLTPIAMLGAAAQVGVGLSGFLSVGVRGYLNLVTVGLPFTIALKENANDVSFEGGLDMTLRTLAGRLSLYVEYIIGEDEFEIASWKGLGPAKIELFDLPKVSMPFQGFDK